MSPRACSSGVTATSTRNATLRPPASMATLATEAGAEVVPAFWPPLLHAGTGERRQRRGEEQRLRTRVPRVHAATVSSNGG